MLCCVVSPSSADDSVSLGEVRWAIATFRDLSRTSAEQLDPRFPFEREVVRNRFMRSATTLCLAGYISMRSLSISVTFSREASVRRKPAL